MQGTHSHEAAGTTGVALATATLELKLELEDELEELLELLEDDEAAEATPAVYAGGGLRYSAASSLAIVPIAIGLGPPACMFKLGFDED